MIATSSKATAWQGRIARDGVLLLALAIPSLFELLGDAGRMALRYDRAAVLDGELWRLLTGNFVHLGLRHYLLNLTALLLLWSLAPNALRGSRGMLVIGGASIGVGVGLLAGAPMVGWYVGLSGVLHGLLAVAARDLVREHRAIGILLGALLVVKLSWENWAGPLPLTAEVVGGPVIVVAHLYGAIGGLLAVLAAEGLMMRRL